jgi:hypothetical protein
MATAERPATARRKPAPRKATAAATRTSAGAAGSTSARAKDRPARTTEAAGRRRPERASATVPAKTARATTVPAKTARAKTVPAKTARAKTVPATATQQPRRVTAAAGRATTTEPARDETGLLGWTSMTVPVVNVQVPMLRARVPGLGARAAEARWAAQAVRANLPPTGRLLYYGGLGLMATVGVLEWPVAAAVGVGVWLAGRPGAGRPGQAVSA